MTPVAVPMIATERLVLRAPRMTDFEAYAAFFASERAAETDGPLDRRGAWREFASGAAGWMLRGYGAWSVEERATGAYCGEVGLFHPAEFPEPEIGWTLMASFEGRGYAFEAALAARGFAYRVLGMTTLVSYIGPGNARSIRLAERLDDAAARPEGDDCVVYRHPGPRSGPAEAAA